VEKKVICSRIINTVWKGRSKNMFLSDGMMVRQRYGPINLGLFNDYNLFIHTPPPFFESYSVDTKSVIDLRQVGGFLRSPPLIKLTATI